MKTITQMKIGLENGPATMFSVCELLGENGIKIIAFYMVEEKDNHSLYFVANDPDRAINILKTARYEVETSDSIACELPSHPGGLNAVIKPLKEADIKIDHIFPCIRTGDITVLILGVSPIGDALQALENNWIKVLGEELYHLWI